MLHTLAAVSNTILQHPAIGKPLLNIPAIMEYLYFIEVCLLVPMAVSITIVGFSFAMHRVVDPSFNLKNIFRWAELLFGYLILAFVFYYSSEIITKHFDLKLPENTQSFTLVIPAIVYLVIRSITRFMSSRVAKELLLHVLFLIVVSFATIASFTLLGVIEPCSFTIFTWSQIAEFLIMGIPVVFLGDYILYYAFKEEIKFKLPRLNKTVKFHIPLLHYVIKDNKLIDLMDKIPVGLTKVIGENEIDSTIADVMKRTKNELKIITRSYQTIEQNTATIKNLYEKNKVIRIIGARPNDESEFTSEEERKEIGERVKKIKNELLPKKIQLCMCEFDQMRLIVRDSNEVMLSFATGGFSQSHLGLYSKHPMVISMFSDYFETKCKGLVCMGKCNSRCAAVNKP